MASANADTDADTGEAAGREGVGQVSVPGAGEIRVSACGVWWWHAGHLVWDDYLARQQRALAPGTDQLIRWFLRWRSLDSLAEMTPDGVAAEQLKVHVRRLLAANVLISFGSPRHVREEQIIEVWGDLGPVVRAFHFSTRLVEGQNFTTPEADAQWLSAKSEAIPPPPAFKSLRNVIVAELPSEDLSVYRDRDLVSALLKRRSRRTYGSAPVSLNAVAEILRRAAGPVPHQFRELPAVFETTFKSSPSGGGRHPTECYLIARRIDGLTPGVYHYNGKDDLLEEIGQAPSSQELVDACAGQHWVAEANAVLVYTSVVARNIWKYAHPRTYRSLLIDVGHVNQTVGLVTTALGLSTCFTAVVRDDLFEKLLGSLPPGEAVIGCATIGSAADQH